MLERKITLMEVDRLLTTEEVAELLNVPVATLRWWRHEGTGPKAFRLGRRKVMYKLSDAVAWREQRYRADQVSASGSNEGGDTDAA
jgi:excisionase family DNA binding protein